MMTGKASLGGHADEPDHILPRTAAQLALGLYALAGRAATPWVRRHLVRRQAKGREDALRLGERFGTAGCPRPPGPLVWIHGASVGEALSALPLIARIQADGLGITLLMTTGTVTSARLMAERLPHGIIHQYAPVDVPLAAQRFLDYWQPSGALILESELWPTLLNMARNRGIGLALVNGRMSAKSFRSWCRFPPLARSLLAGFNTVLAQSPEDRDRLAALGARSPIYCGNLKFAADPLPYDPVALETIRAMIGVRPCWLAASTHPGEETIVGAVHRSVAADHPNLLTIIVPRHPDRAADIAAGLRASGLVVAQRSADETIARDTEIYLADSVGEMGQWYRLVQLVFVGKSLVQKGGQNLLEPAQLDNAIMVGPHTSNFARLADELAQAGGLCRVAGPTELASQVNDLLSNEKARKTMMVAAKKFVTEQAGCLDDIYGAIKPLLERALQADQTLVPSPIQASKE